VNEPKRVRRNMTARELGERFDRSPRTIRRVIALSRATYEAEAAERQRLICTMREQGMTMRAIATELGISPGTVHYAIKKNRAA